MKIKLIILLTIALYGISISAQTNVGGIMTSNTTWTNFGSPYNIISDIGIPNGITLTIEAGVVINFNSSNKMVIQGNFIASGNFENLITINQIDTGNAMILFQKTNLSNSVLSHILINRLEGGIKLSSNSSDNNSGILSIDSVMIQNSKIETNGNNSNALLIINNSNLNNTKIQGDYPNSEVIKINNSVITDCEISSYSYNYGIFLNNDTISNTSLNAGCCSANLNVFSSIVSDCSFTEQSGMGGAYLFLNIDGSQVYNTEINMPLSTVTINNCNFHYNTSYFNSICVISGNGSIDSTIFVGNGGLIAIERGPNGIGQVYDNINPWTITHCKFSGFATDIKTNALTGTDYGSGQVTISNCDFMDIPSDYIVNNNSHHDVFASSNWWGTVITSEIDNSIYDKWDNFSKGEVIYSNYLSEPINTTISIHNTDNLNNDISVYPNPFMDFIKIHTNNNNYNLKIYNSLGQKIIQKDNLNGQQTIDCSILNTGIYLIQIQKNNLVIGQMKIIKQ